MLLVLWLLLGFVDACYLRSSVGPMPVRRWVALVVLGPVPLTLALFNYLEVNFFDKRI